jgi:hypothetical protein
MASTEANRISDLAAQLRGTYTSESKAIVAARIHSIVGL